MNFRKEADPSGVKGLLALLRTNQDGNAPEISSGAPGVSPGTSRYGSRVQQPTTRPYGTPAFGSSARPDHQASNRSTPTATHTAQWARPSTFSSSSSSHSQSGSATSAPHPLDHPDAATNHSYLAQWETETRALNDARKVGGGNSRGGDLPGSQYGTTKETIASGGKPSSTAASNPQLMALLDTLRSTGAIMPTPSTEAFSISGPSRTPASTAYTRTTATSSPAPAPAPAPPSGRAPKSILKLATPSASPSSPKSAREDALSRYTPHNRTSDASETDRTPKRRKMGIADGDGEPAGSAGSNSKSMGFSVASIRSSVVEEGGARKGDSTLGLRRKEMQAKEASAVELDHDMDTEAVQGKSGADEVDQGEGNRSDAATRIGEAQRHMPFAQALGVIAGLLESADVLAKLQQLKIDQDKLEKGCFMEREKLVKGFDKRIAIAGDKNNPGEAARLATEKKRHLKQYDSSLLKRFDDLEIKQHQQLEGLGIPGLGVVPTDAGSKEFHPKDKDWRKKRAKVMKVLEEAIAVD